MSAFNDHVLVIFDGITPDFLALYKEKTKNNEDLFDSYIKETVTFLYQALAPVRRESPC